MPPRRGRPICTSRTTSARLPAAVAAARRHGARLGFDAEDYHRGQPPVHDAAARALAAACEERYLPGMRLRDRGVARHRRRVRGTVPDAADRRPERVSAGRSSARAGRVAGWPAPAVLVLADHRTGPRSGGGDPRDGRGRRLPDRTARARHVAVRLCGNPAGGGACRRRAVGARRPSRARRAGRDGQARGRIRRGPRDRAGPHGEFRPWPCRTNSSLICWPACPCWRRRPRAHTALAPALGEAMANRARRRCAGDGGRAAPMDRAAGGPRGRAPGGLAPGHDALQLGRRAETAS